MSLKYELGYPRSLTMGPFNSYGFLSVCHCMYSSVVYRLSSIMVMNMDEKARVADFYRAMLCILQMSVCPSACLSRDVGIVSQYFRLFIM